MPARPEVLHYVGSDHDRGGVISVIRNLADAGRFRCVLGVNAGCVQSRQPPLPVRELPRIAGERIGAGTCWRARTVARAVQEWLQESPDRIYHGHSRAGLLVALWLARWGEKRVVVSVHCYGRQRWFYRWAANRLGSRLYWLSPAMKKYYAVADDRTWAQCVPGCVGPAPAVGSRPAPADGVVHLAGIGALVRWKRWELIVAALAQLPDELQRRVRFRHIGAAEDDADSRAYAAELRTVTAANPAIAWLGQQGSSAALLAESDVLAIASHQEPFSIAMLEALQAGVPVLAADSGGAADIVRPGVNGWLFSSGDAGALAAQLMKMASGPGKARCVPDAAGLRPFSAEVVSAQWLAIYEGQQGAP